MQLFASMDLIKGGFENKMKKFKRVISFVLALAMALSCMIVPVASAAGATFTMPSSKRNYYS